MDKKQLTFVMDIDGTICPLKEKGQDYADLVPYSAMVDKIRQYKSDGAKIVFYSSRNMNSYNGNLGLINANTAPVLLAWLEKWNIPYDELYFGKPWPGFHGFYVDDRTIRPDEFLSKSVEELDAICDLCRCKE